MRSFTAATVATTPTALRSRNLLDQEFFLWVRQSRPHYGGVQAVVGLLIMSSLSACHAVLHMCVWGSQFWPL
jgi:hypothetical protein